ncbi:MAG: asparagine synthase (glutamine-hydrolyzing) [Gammaproteobacteria bacterium]|nr:MAG: asparagine synthase (glutamine-hydrolyzing) [Gammaproteobacteria bacterium]
MCGLVGIASTQHSINRSWLCSGRDTMTHRGPDDAGEWWSDDGRVGLGHRRLSIIDLSPLGHQPMRDEHRGLTIVFNGEIYNHSELRNKLVALGFVFNSQSDTEVLLAAYAAWGEECLAHLNGMFTFALFDDRQQKLFLTRDRAGEKPLFYHFKDGTLQFSSELKALLANPSNPQQINSVSLDCYLGMGFIPGELCILKGYNKLPPAHAMRFDLQSGKLKTWRYWKLPELSTFTPAETKNENELLNELETLLEDAVGQQLVADVPVGVLLSGGLDSSLVTAMAVRRSQKVRTFTIGFPGHGKLDETQHARKIANHFGTVHTELMAEPTTADLIPQLAEQFDEPMVDSSMIPTWLVSNLVRQHCTVALGGDGGDELFGGYSYYTKLAWMEHKLTQIPSWIRNIIARTSEKWLPVGMKSRNYLQGCHIDLRNCLPLQVAGIFDATTRRKLMRNVPNYNLIAEDIYRNRTPKQQDIIQRVTRMDFQNYLSEDILVKVDRASMMNSLEVRAPLLDHRLIEFAFGHVPSHLKATLSDKKVLLKRLAHKVLPPEFEKKRKQGFSIPLNEWLKAGPFRELIWDTLTRADCLFDQVMVQNLLNGQDRGFNNGERLFALTQFELWRQHYRVGL